jgi:hypothetical protein
MQQLAWLALTLGAEAAHRPGVVLLNGGDEELNVGIASTAENSSQMAQGILVSALTVH